ncbi:hypothetical protein [Salininema proteolyticum]|uniref:Transmembrane protein n=1 Tax=Salininema proteolyticum TaxID=1607685 RepID=A0ABV8TZT6_9ACTN
MLTVFRRTYTFVFRYWALVAAVMPAIAGVLIFFSGFPGDKEVLMWRGQEVRANDVCEFEVNSGYSTGAFELEKPCKEVGEKETVYKSWDREKLVIGPILFAFGTTMTLWWLHRARKRRRNKQRPTTNIHDRVAPPRSPGFDGSGSVPPPVAPGFADAGHLPPPVAPEFGGTAGAPGQVRGNNGAGGVPRRTTGDRDTGHPQR